MSKVQPVPTPSVPAVAEFDVWVWGTTAALAVATLAAPAAIFHYTKRTAPFKKEYQKDHVYVYQLSRSPVIPSLSSNCLALETYLRLAKIKYENIVGNHWLRSAKNNTVPFIEINGKQFAGANNAIAQLQDVFQRSDERDDKVTIKKVEEVAENLLWCCTYFRYVKNDFLSEKIVGKGPPTSPVMAWCSPIMIRLMLNNDKIYREGDRKKMSELIKESVDEKVKEKFVCRRLVEEEIATNAENHLKALSNVLSDKVFFMGDSPSSTDAILFGVLAQIYFVPLKMPMRKLMKSGAYKNLGVFCERMKNEFWPDWSRILKTGNMNTMYYDVDDD